MLYSGIALGFVGGFLGIAVGVAALVGGILGRTLGGDISMSAAVLALAVSLVALAGAINMRRHWRAGVLLDAACAVLGYAALPEYYLAPAIALVLPAILYVAGDLILRRRAAGQVKHAVNQARKQYAQTGELDMKRDMPVNYEVANMPEQETDDAKIELPAQSFDIEFDVNDITRENPDKTELQAKQFDEELNLGEVEKKRLPDDGAQLKTTSFDEELGISKDESFAEAKKNDYVKDETEVDTSDAKAEDDNQPKPLGAVEQAQADHELNAAQSISSAAERAMYGCDSIVGVPGNALDQAMSAGEAMAQSASVKLESDNANIDEAANQSEAPQVQPSQPRQPISRGARKRQGKRQKGR